MNPTLFIVIPCYNEEKVLPITASLFLEELNTLQEKELISDASRVLFVNDGSRDGTWELICKLAEQDPRVLGISLSRNCGHQNALYAGLMYAKERCDITVSIDCDGQDDVRAMEEMVRKYRDEQCEIVYGVRSARNTDTLLKRSTAQGFYRVMKMMGAETVFNHADYRLMSSLALEGLAEFHEVNLYLRGLVPLIGYKSDSVYYERTRRIAGESHYPFRKMLSLAVNGITSLSTTPISMITTAGVILGGVGVLGLIAQAVIAICGVAVPTWTVLLAAMVLLGGIQLVALGVVGSYVGKIYLESKGRPRYIIAQSTEGRITKF